MDHGMIPGRYAKALLELAIEENFVEDVRADMQNLLELTSLNKDVIDLLDSPLMHIEQKQQVLKAILSGKVSELSLSFVMLVVENKRENFLDSICRVFLEKYRVYKGQKKVYLRSAIALDEKEENEIKNVLKKSLGTQIDMETEVDKDLIGGFILRVDDQQLDNSIASKLRDIKKELLSK